jgi:hypothetical protein
MKTLEPGSGKQGTPSSTAKKLRIFKSNVNPVLLCGFQTWRVTNTLSGKLQIFVNSRLRHIINIRLPDKISTKNLWQRANQEPIT